MSKVPLSVSQAVVFLTSPNNEDMEALASVLCTIHFLKRNIRLEFKALGAEVSDVEFLAKFKRWNTAIL